MGSKGSNVQQTAKQQVYTPNPYIAQEGMTALTAANAAAGQSYAGNMPVAPVAGFSPDQLAAFQNVRGVQGAASPYFNAAGNYISQGATPDINKYFGAEVAGVMPELENVFGQQRAQNTGNLVQSAGGVGADRIAVGQANLANQQGLAAGQTVSQIYGQAANQANTAAQLQQSAGFGMANVGAAQQNAALQAINAQLGTGGLQQQLSQAQANAPYNWQVGNFAYPFQVGQYLSGITAGLAPSQGGTTTGQGMTTSPGPSMLSQILGLGLGTTGILGQTNAFGNNGWMTGSGKGSNTASYTPQDAGMGYDSAKAFTARGGPINPYAEGGDVEEAAAGAAGMRPLSYRDLYRHIASTPALSAQHDPQAVIDEWRNHVPMSDSEHLNRVLSESIAAADPVGQYGVSRLFGRQLNPFERINEAHGIANSARRQASGFAGGGAPTGGGLGDDPFKDMGAGIVPDIPLTAGKIDVPTLDLDPPKQQASASGSGSNIDWGKLASAAGTAAMMFLARGGNVNPYAAGEGYEEGGELPTYDMGDEQATQNWRTGRDLELGHEQPELAQALPFTGETNDGGDTITSALRPGQSSPAGSPYAPPSPETGQGGDDMAGADRRSPYAPASGADARMQGATRSPWAALTAAGFGMMAGTSPFAGVNIGHGMQAGLKEMEGQRTQQQKERQIDLHAKQLEQQADHWNKQLSQQRELAQLPYNQMTAYQRASIENWSATTDMAGRPVLYNKRTGETREIKRPEDDAALPRTSTPTSDIHAEGDTAGRNPSVLDKNPEWASTIKAISEGRMNLNQVPMKVRPFVERALNDYDPSWNTQEAGLRQRAWNDLSTNGNAGKLILATNQLIPHLATALDRAEKLHNNNVLAGNVVKNWVQTQLGAPGVKDFEAVREVASMDAARLLRGSGQMAEKDIEFWRQNLASANSPAQLARVIHTLADDLIGARVSSIEHGFRLAVKQNPPKLVSPEAEAAMAKIKEAHGRMDPTGGGGGGTPAAPAAPAAAGAGPTDADRAYARAHPEVREKFIQRFKVEP